ncbi:hypothetical protein EPO44_09785 [bacterium]|nr:MAG: hypothetical protein EPO44_09785 [bacterium]
MKKYILMVAVLTVALTAFSAAYADVDIEFGHPLFGNVMVPDDVTITLGETVNFLVQGNHEVNIYRVDDATTRDDILADIIPGEDYIINDAALVDIVNTANRDLNHPGPPDNQALVHDHTTSAPSLIAGNTFDVDPGTVARDLALSVRVRFTSPGRYLVFCGRKNHLDQGLLGFVTVLP